jgi:integrase
VDTATFARKLNRALTRAELPEMSPHRLRHSAATFMAVAGVNPRIAMEALGHSDLSMTMGVYQHVNAAMQREVAEGMETLLTGTD